MYPRKLALEIVELLTKARPRAWALVSSTFYFRDEILVKLFQKNQKIWNLFKYSLKKIEEIEADEASWRLALDRQNREETALMRDLLAFGGIAAFVAWAAKEDQYQDQYDWVRFTKRRSYEQLTQSTKVNDVQLILGLDI
jgi:xanthine dehydrogenase iron-sulfur cluster and FAD-binding subunit A